MRHKLSIITVALCAALMCGCFKDVIDYTNFNTAIYEQATTTGSYVRATDVEMYAYAVDTTEWRIASYEDALAHRITNKTTGEVLTEPDAYGSFNPSDEYQSSIRLDAPISMLVVVSSQTGTYRGSLFQKDLHRRQVEVFRQKIIGLGCQILERIPVHAFRTRYRYHQLAVF